MYEVIPQCKLNQWTRVAGLLLQGEKVGKELCLNPEVTSPPGDTLGTPISMVKNHGVLGRSLERHPSLLGLDKIPSPSTMTSSSAKVSPLVGKHSLGMGRWQPSNGMTQYKGSSLSLF